MAVYLKTMWIIFWDHINENNVGVKEGNKQVRWR
jgi:hypothetical protein